MMKRIAFTFLLASTAPFALPSSPAHAEHKSPLADAPAIRKRVELRDKRFEIGVGAGSTVNETFYHGVMVSGHLAFHITDIAQSCLEAAEQNKTIVVRSTVERPNPLPLILRDGEID